MTQFEIYKSFLFVAELLVAEFMFVYRLPKRRYFPLRAIAGILSCFGVAFALPVLSENAIYTSVLFLVIFAYTVLVCKVLFSNSWITLIFCCLAGYTTQHLSYELYNIALSIMNVPATDGFYGSGEGNLFPNIAVFVTYLFIYVIAYCVSYFLFSRKLAGSGDINLKSTFIFVFAVFILIIDIILNAVVVYNPRPDMTLHAIIISIYNVLCCLVSLYLQFEVALRRRIEKDYDAMRDMVEQQKKQYALSKENIELINIKCHDLRHQLRELEGSRAITPGALKSIADSISIYDSMVRTGNDALDIILTEKSLVCSKENIQFSCIVDGEKLGFFSDEDVYALFGNIIDNAIEAVRDVEPSKRTISLRVRMIGDMLVVGASNYYASAIKRSGGEIVTSKDDKNHHGFGLKSIRYICERYGGSMDIKTDNNVFAITLLFFVRGDAGGEKKERS